MRPERLSDIIGSVYDCVLEPQEWSRTLPLISAFGESAASSIVVQGRLNNSGARIFEDGDRQSFLRLYFEKLAASRMPAMKQVAFDHLGEVATMTMLAGEREPLNSDFYLKWVRPLGFRDVIGVLVLKSGKRVAWFSVARSDVQSRFTESDLRQMELLSPHICRALLISDALDLQSIVATRLAETVDHLSTGVLLTEEKGRIAYMNGSAEAILKDSGALKSKDGHLVATRPHARDALSRALEESSAGRAPSTSGQHAIPLPDEEGSGLIANVLPLQWRDGRNPLAALPGAAAVIIQNPAEGAPAPIEAIGLLYGLTAAERNVLEHVAASHSPQETADRLGVSVNTVKTHLQKIFAKTNTARQADLVSLVARSTAPLKSKR
ncbi:helix-turn-helix transcriptional regulator [Bradyrhizobium sp. BWA-3-5]|uniref:helix-turn-helix transcriptional regulator n=1 Tax=Bradyrhizobium sp. BWA-3-5 TaxID=3080013 RepID=UPI00293EE07E|nr:helix-turn-helix transcriptional regulator [Bradyrhizobium sp. BWA-3-5]WOH65693.1 helix-turn-helix transcriptional regulator [Bradyrhizobium sp. BWA-3-5]